MITWIFEKIKQGKCHHKWRITGMITCYGDFGSREVKTTLLCPKCGAIKNKSGVNCTGLPSYDPREEEQMLIKQIKFIGNTLNWVISGEKTETRRIIKDHLGDARCGYYLDCYRGEVRSDSNPQGKSDIWSWYTPDHRLVFPQFTCPYGKPGDLLNIDGTDIAVCIVDIRIERLQDISSDGVKAEGITPHELRGELFYGIFRSHKFAFESIWNSIYGRGSWDENPWVWVIEFKRVEGE